MLVEGGAERTQWSAAAGQITPWTSAQSQRSWEEDTDREGADREDADRREEEEDETWRKEWWCPSPPDYVLTPPQLKETCGPCGE
ncbi:hypothetical protein NDU88_005414 [Pleurodeles waltl]|uniref:Uncharacterized protein n=1 Tax=Pleurodeles waltl TaxID=8319 RepID=A0AAV7PKB0_PLEWA|nr:hypothetical protein NDU88_005414 [Pleurodeles waltl]